VIGLRCDDGSFIYAPDQSYVLKEDEVVLVVCPAHHIQVMRADGERRRQEHQSTMIWQRLALQSPIPIGSRIYSLEESEAAVQALYSHYIICTGGRVAQNAINELDPNRAFVVISNDEDETQDLLQRGFRVIFGNPSDEKVLKKAGIVHALAVMIAMDDRARNVLTVLNCRTMNKHVLIVATAETDEMVPKLYQAGADRVLNPFHIASQFVLMATTRPVVSEFVRYVLFNRETGLETTELYMEQGAPWIGQTLRELALKSRYNAGVIGIRHANGQFLYAPSADHVIIAGEVLIVVTPMSEADNLRSDAYGGADKRPKSIRTMPFLTGN
jgi:Trk K+ transport system NAD-binding subunit